MSTVKAKQLETGHQDLINDVAFDYYGARLATCACDHTVKVWDKCESSGEWSCNSSWKAHCGAVWKVNWAHPEFGQVLATCSFDRTVAIWEEIVSGVMSDVHQNTWVRRAALVESRTSVTDVRFSPRTMALQLATMSADGVVRVYEAADPMNLSSWSLEHEFSVRCSASCLSWSTTPSLLPQLLAVGSNEPPLAASLAPSSGDNSGSGSATTQTAAVPVSSSSSSSATVTASAAGYSSGSVSSTGSSCLGRVFIYAYCKQTRKWTKTQNLTSISDKVHDLSFAPNMGRTFHLLAVASSDVRVVALSHSAASPAGGSGSVGGLEAREVARLCDHRSVVWRLAWNITGTILGSSGDDGCVRLWKSNYLNEWKCVHKLMADSSDHDADVTMTAQSRASAAAPGGPSGPGDSLLSCTALSTAKYFKLGSVKHPNQVVWH